MNDILGLRLTFALHNKGHQSAPGLQCFLMLSSTFESRLSVVVNLKQVAYLLNIDETLEGAFLRSVPPHSEGGSDDFTFHGQMN